MDSIFKKSATTENLLLFIAPFFLWGTAMVAMKSVIEHTTPFFLASLRLVPAGILVLGFAIISQRPQPKTFKAWFWIIIFAIVDASLFQGFLATGLVRTNAGLGSVIIDSQPLLVALLSSWLFGEIIGLFGFLGLAIGILGITLIGFPDDWVYGIFQGNFSVIQLDLLGLLDNGEWFMFLAALSMAVGTILIRYVCKHSDPIVATGWHMILGGIPLLIISAWRESDQWVNLTISDMGAISYAAILGGAIAYGIFFYLASKNNLTSLSALTFLTPVFALLFGNLILSEVLSSLQLAGVGLTLISIYLINMREKLNFAASNLENNKTG